MILLFMTLMLMSRNNSVVDWLSVEYNTGAVVSKDKLSLITADILAGLGKLQASFMEGERELLALSLAYHYNIISYIEGYSESRITKTLERVDRIVRGAKLVHSRYYSRLDINALFLDVAVIPVFKSEAGYDAVINKLKVK